MMEALILLGGLIILVYVCIFFHRLMGFILTAYFGKNIKLSYIDKSGMKHSDSIHLDNDDKLLSILDKIQKNRKAQDH